MRPVWLLLPTVLLAGCVGITPHDAYAVHVHSSVAAERVPVAIGSFDNWHVRAGTAFDVLSTDDRCTSDSCIEVDEIEPRDVENICDHDINHAWGCTRGTHIYVVRDRPNPADYPIIYRHEIGHALDLDHVTDVAVMNPAKNLSSPAGNVVTCADVAQYNTVRGRRAGFCED